jgi:hypothetical protein
LLLTRPGAGNRPRGALACGKGDYHSGQSRRFFSTLRNLWGNERIEQVAERHHSGSYAGLHGTERLTQPDGDLVVTQALVVSDLDDLALLRAEEGEGALDCPLYISLSAPFLRGRSR